MPMDRGNEGGTVGVTAEVWAELEKTGYPGEKLENESDEDYAVRKDKMLKFVYAVAIIINHIQNNADVATTVSPGTFSVASAPGPVAGVGNGSGSGPGAVT